jgi:uncharacterized protein (DUF58 family)
MRVIRELFTQSRLYKSSSVIVLLFVFGYFFDPLFFIAKLLLLIFLFLLAADLSLLFFTRQKVLLLRREIPERFSNGDENRINIFIKNNHYLPVLISIVDEIPSQFQLRKFHMYLHLGPGEEKKMKYSLKPLERGEYEFGRTNAYVSTYIKLFSRKCQFGQKSTIVKVYPSFLKMRQYELLAISNRLTEAGIKRTRQLGTHSEFDQIKDYVKGDNYRTINWKSTAKRAKLMVNQYQEERSQQVYSLIDMGRVMKMPFEGMSLLDYAINTSLIISNTAIYKHDKAGIVTFNKTIDSFLPAENKNRTMLKILETLYKQETLYDESDYELLTATIKRRITHRSLLILYTNFESLTSLQRHLFYLKNIARNHLLLVVIFENTEIRQLLRKSTKNLQEIYIKTIAEKFIHDKHLIVKELNKHGILALLTKPKSLTTNLINRYLELKNIGWI